MTDYPIKQSDDFDGAVLNAATRIVNMFRRKIESAGYDISFENYGDLRAGVEGELADFDSRVRHLRHSADEAPKCNHWPGQKRCGVCGMGLEVSSQHHQSTHHQQEK
jgi:hypothetical protein